MEIREIKSRLPLSEVVKHYGLKVDKQNRLRCPFHNDKTPSMQLRRITTDLRTTVWHISLYTAILHCWYE